MRGTPYFMAPEVFEEKYSSKADIWAVGCVAYQMVTGFPPWKKLNFTNPVALFNYIKNRQSPPDFELSENFTDCDSQRRNFLSLMEECFARSPFDRPSADALLNHTFLCTSSHIWSTEQQDRWEDKSLHDMGSPAPTTAYLTSPTDLCAAGRMRRRRSFGGSTNQTPFLSPPLPKSSSRRRRNEKGTHSTPKTLRSPTPDMQEWPTWAKEKYNSESCDQVTPVTQSAAANKENQCIHQSPSASRQLDDSLQYTWDTPVSAMQSGNEMFRGAPTNKKTSDMSPSNNSVSHSGVCGESLDMLGGLKFLSS